MENNKKIWDNLTNLYPVSKTLRFELKPIENTLEWINKNGLIEEDQKREIEFDEIKKIMDNYYKYYIEKVLKNVSFDIEELNEFRVIYEKLKKEPRNEELKKEFIKNQKSLRNKVYNIIKNDKDFLKLFKKEFVYKILPLWLEENDNILQKELVLKFNKWATYFTGFFNNRKNVFSKEEIPTSIIYRIINDNLPKFLDNVSKIEKLSKFENISFFNLENNFKDELNGYSLINFFSLENFNNCLNQSGIDRFNLIIGGKSEEGNVKLKGLNELINEFSNKAENKENKRFIKNLKLVPLFKQILSDKKSFSFQFDKFSNNEEVFKEIDDFYIGNEKNEGFVNIVFKLRETIEKLKESNLNNIYIRNGLTF